MLLKKISLILLSVILSHFSCTSMRFTVMPVDKNDPDIVKIKKFKGKQMRSINKRTGIYSHELRMFELCEGKDLVYIKFFMYVPTEIWCR